MIDTQAPTVPPDQDETLLTLGQLAKQLLATWPDLPDGTRPTEWSVYQRVRKYAVKGYRGVFLEARRRGTLWIVTRAAWERFEIACAERSRPKSPAADMPTERQFQAQQRRLREEAKALGIL